MKNKEEDENLPHGSTSPRLQDTYQPTDNHGTPPPVQCPPSVNERALMRKIDLRLLPVLFIIYVVAFLDRVNISNALIMGLPKDLNIVGTKTNVALTIFFVPYIVFEIPSNILLKRLKPHIWLSGCILSFGIVMLCQGFVQNYSGILATRFFLGLAEAGVFPGSFYLISFWYKREESQKRFTIYWCSVLTANAFGGLLASGIANMDGVSGLHNWRWVFILEGIVTILIGFGAFFLVSDFPEQASWLNEEERGFVIARAGARGQTQPVQFRDVMRFFTYPRNLIGAVMYFSALVPLYSFAYFAPTIIKTFGYTVVQTQLHTVPPMAAALALCLIAASLSDATGIRLPFVAFCTMLTIVGLAILMTTHHSFPSQYAGICLVAMGAFSVGPIIICWYVMNLHGHAQRSVGSAWMIGFGNSGGIIATFAFLTSDAPLYHKGYSICMGVTCLGALATTIYASLIWSENRRLRVAQGDKHQAKFLSL